MRTEFLIRCAVELPRSLFRPQPRESMAGLMGVHRAMDGMGFTIVAELDRQCRDRWAPEFDGRSARRAIPPWTKGSDRATPAEKAWIQ